MRIVHRDTSDTGVIKNLILLTLIKLANGSLWNKWQDTISELSATLFRKVIDI